MISEEHVEMVAKLNELIAYGSVATVVPRLEGGVVEEVTEVPWVIIFRVEERVKLALGKFFIDEIVTEVSIASIPGEDVVT